MNRLISALITAVILMGTFSLPVRAEVRESNVQIVYVDVTEELDDPFIRESIPDEEAYIPEGLEKTTESIIGKDTRIRIRNCGKFPYTAMALLEVEYKCGCWALGTGFMASRCRMLTAAHCLYCTDHHSPARYIDFFFGYDHARSTSYYVYSGKFTAYLGTRFNKTVLVEKDYAVIKFPVSIGARTGYLAPQWQLSEKKLTNRNCYVAGYSLGRSLKYGKGRIRVMDETRIRYETDTQAGESGGPIYTTAYKVLGIHTDGGKRFNYGQRLTKAVLTLFRK